MTTPQTAQQGTQPAPQQPPPPTALSRAIDELKQLQVSNPAYRSMPIGSILQGYNDQWKEFSEVLRLNMLFQKRTYILVIRLLPKGTHKDIINALINEYRAFMDEYNQIVNDAKRMQELEEQDIAMFDQWVLDGATGNIPILKSYRQALHRRNITDDNNVVQV